MEVRHVQKHREPKQNSDVHFQLSLISTVRFLPTCPGTPATAIRERREEHLIQETCEHIPRWNILPSFNQPSSVDPMQLFSNFLSNDSDSQSDFGTTCQSLGILPICIFRKRLLLCIIEALIDCNSGQLLRRHTTIPLAGYDVGRLIATSIRSVPP